MRDAAAATPVTVGIVAGEASGDALAATLIHAVRARHPGVRFAGIAGPRMEAAGCEVWFPLEKLAVRGFVEVVAHLPELFGIRRQLRRRLLAGAFRQSNPDSAEGRAYLWLGGAAGQEATTDVDRHVAKRRGWAWTRPISISDSSAD